ncbi:hypothetical protein DFH06DRAFT_606842 [Mycena polygramma]|nr:hypothetical protein DFH06DRAFT_606842 [Mycena polygramma]
MPPFETFLTVNDGSSASPALSRKKAREMKLRADKLADVQSPTLVHCLNCGAAIKLSHKSEYDASHWLRHRGRCLKKSKAREVERALMKAAVLSATSSSTGSSPSPASSERALTPPDDNDAQQPRIADPEFPDWQSWDWSKLKSRFLPPL